MSDVRPSLHRTGETASQSPARGRLCLTGAMLTHPGVERLLNEDVVVYVLPRPDEPLARRSAFALVADGMGGHAAGEVASRLAAETVRRRYYELPGPVPEVLAASLAAANEAVFLRSLTDADCAGMGTTCTVLVVEDDLAYLGHVGDSRAYILRDGHLRQISQDHSVVAELVRSGTISASEASRSPYRNLVLQALGTKPTIAPLIWDEGLPVRAGDVFVLCSDGLTDLLDDHVIADMAGRLPPLEACQRLIDATLAAGGDDNVSLGIFVVGERASATSPERPTRRIVPNQIRGGAR
jgi:serine/threonine protein phosphatase PrpC